MGDEDIRVGDAERERTVDALREHAAHGRLDVEELDERIGAVHATRTRGELVALTRDLPALPAAPAPAPARPPARRERRELVHFRRQAVSVAVLLVFLIGIWAASGAGYFWPVWPALGLGLALGLSGARAWTRPDEDERPD